MRGRFHAPARGDHVGTVAEQLARQHVGHAGGVAGQQGRAGDLQAAVRALAQQRGERVARGVDLLLRGLDLLVGAGAGALRVADLQLVV